MRIVTGFLFVWHGRHKLFSVPAAMQMQMQMSDFIRDVAGAIELICGTMVMVGRFTSGGRSSVN